MCRVLILCSAVALLLASCQNDVSEISFSRDIAPIFEGRCNICHHSDSAIGYELDNAFDSERGIVGRKNSWAEGHDSPYEYVVDPGRPENSSLIAKVRSLDLDPLTDGSPMPKLPEYLSETELVSVEQWIAGGARNDPSFIAVTRIFGTEITLRPSASGRCTWCHYPGSPTGLDVLNIFDPEEGMVNVESSAGGTLVVPGNPDQSVLMHRLRGQGGARMPLHFSRLSEPEVQLLEDWVVAGAPNN